MTTFVKLFAVIIAGTLLMALTPSPAKTTAQMWDVVDVGDWTLQVRSIERVQASELGADGECLKADQQFALIAINVTNGSSQSQAIDAAGIDLVAPDGQTFLNRSDETAARVYADANGYDDAGASIAPGETRALLLIYDVDPSATKLKLEFPLAPHLAIELAECHCSLPLPASKGTEAQDAAMNCIGR
jgi:hypothetical protein